VAVIRADERTSAAERQADLDEAGHHVQLAAGRANRPEPALILMHGLSGSGKTHVSSLLLAALPAIRVRSDLERKRLAGLGEFESSESPPGEGLYDADSGKRTYERLRSLATIILDARHSVIIDAAFLDSGERQAARSLAERMHVPVLIVDVQAPDAVLRQRIAERAARRDAASEADGAVLEYQLSTAHALTPAERELTIACDNSVSSGTEELVKKVRDAIDHR
jgi:predicted kinase